MPAPSQPEKNPSPAGERHTVLGGFMKADSMVEIALALPLSTIIGWLLGDFIGRHLHATWPAIVGLILGVIAGFIQIVRLANKANRNNP
jgi:F0F1-type ATP synthase assembly protein I